MLERARLRRRHVLRLTGLAGGAVVLESLLQACGAAAPAPVLAPTAAASPTSSPVAVPTQTPAQPSAATTGNAAASPPADWQQQLDTAQAGAKQEGKVSLIVPPGDNYRGWAEAFQNKYGIQVELLPGNGGDDITPRVAAERQAGQFNWDLVVHSPGVQFAGLEQLNVMDNLRPLLVSPDVLDDSKWLRGFEAGWWDLKQSTCYDFVSFVDFTTSVNRAFVPESQLSTLDQIWDQEWKGKIAMYDPRVGGAGLGTATAWMLTLGEDRLRTFFETQQLALTQDRRQLGEWIVRGEYPIAVGLAPDSLTPLSSQGVDVTPVQPLDPRNPKGLYLSSGAGTMGLLTQAPHPHAAKLFANWVLSQESQELFGKASGYDSRRLDVLQPDPPSVPDPSLDYVSTDNEKNYAVRASVTALAKATLS